MTGVLGPNVPGDLAVDFEAVIDKQLLAWLDGSEGMNEYAIARLGCLAIGCARVVQKAGAVAAAAAVNHASVGKSERECVPEFRSLSCCGPPPAGQFAFVLDEPLAGGQRLQRKQSLAMH